MYHLSRQKPFGRELRCVDRQLAVDRMYVDSVDNVPTHMCIHSLFLTFFQSMYYTYVFYPFNTMTSNYVVLTNNLCVSGSVSHS